MDRQARPRRRRWQAHARHAVRALVGPLALAAVLATAPLVPSAATAADGGGLVIATWNIPWLRSAPLDAVALEQCRSMPRDMRATLDERDPRRWICRGPDDYAALRRVAERVDADVFALQEVEDARALERIFPPSEYAVHVADGPWIQKTAFAVRRARVPVIGFETYAALGAPLGSLRGRHGADLTVRQPNGRPLRLLAVHLKSACHSRSLTDASASRHDREGDRPACHVLADQVAPLEAWIDARAREGVDFVVLGDFNRRFDAAIERGPVRDGRGRAIALWPDLDDGDPPGARLVRLTAGRTQLESCRSGDRNVDAAERAMFIDHIVVGGALARRVEADSFRQWAVLEGRPNRALRRRLATLSDHCPLSVRLAP